MRPRNSNYHPCVIFSWHALDRAVCIGYITCNLHNMRMKKIFLLIAFTLHTLMRMYAAGGSVCCPSDTEKVAKPLYNTVR